MTKIVKNGKNDHNGPKCFQNSQIVKNGKNDQNGQKWQK